MAEPEHFVEGAKTPRPSSQIGRQPTIFNLQRIGTGLVRAARAVTGGEELAPITDPEELRKRALESSKEKFRFFAERSIDDVLKQMHTDAKQVNAFRPYLDDSDEKSRFHSFR